MKNPTKTLLGLAAAGITAVQAAPFDYLEDFEGHADPSPAATAGWSLATDTDAPATVTAAFANNDDLNVTKLTAANDTTSLFDSTYFYHEHDIAAGEVVTQGNFAGQDAGDFLLTTTKPATDFGATSIDLRGATFHVDHQHGQEFTSRPVFWFAIVLADGSRWTADDSIATTGGDAMLTSSSDPITTATEFRRILDAGGAAGQRLRLADTPSLLTEAQLMDVREVGLYTRPVTAGVPARFDNFRLEGYDLTTATTATITHTRTGTIYIDDADPEAFAEYMVSSVPKFSPQSGTLVDVEISLSADWTSGYTFQNDADGAAGDAQFTPHPYLWTATRLPDSWSFTTETTGAPQLQSFAAGSGGAASDTAGGTISSTVTAPLDQVAKFVGTGSAVLDVEVRNDGLYENLSATPDAGTFTRSINADVTLTVTYTYTPAAIASGVLFVNHAATGSNDGSSWANAFTDFQSAIAAALPGNEIWVAQGTYHPDAPGGDRNASFVLRGGVSWFGGFAGTETARDQRDPATHPTILSGDLNEDDGGGTGVNARWYNMSDNAYSVVTGSNLLLPATIDGFTLTRGSFSSTFSGSGMNLNFCSDVTVANCRFIGNLSGSAAGMLSSASNTTVLGCYFEDNYSFDGRGGAIYHSGDWQDFSTSYLLTVHDSTFFDNRAAGGSTSGAGGAIYSQSRAPVHIDGCLFENNRSDWRFAYGSYASSGGAMIIFSGNSRVTNSTFRGNRAHVGGALWITRDTQVVNCLFVKNEAFRQSVEPYDYGGYAGAIYAPGGASTIGTALIDHCTFHANTARNVGGIWGNHSLTISNSILYTNTSTEVEATLLDQQLNGDPMIINSCVKGLEVLDNGNIDADPVFFDQDGADNIIGNADDDLHLNNGSPCIDSGDDSRFPADLAAVDIDGAPRFQDDPLSADSASDMGAYEFVPGSGTGGGPDPNILPVASFTYAVGAANEVTFTDTSTDSDGSIVQWIWNFGDGDSSVTNHPVHTFAANGTYTVTLTVRDDQNGTDLSDSSIITVSGLVAGSVSISSPADGATVSGIVPINVDATPDIVRVKLYIDGVYTNQKDTSPPFSIDWDSTTVAEGPHTVEFKTNDDTDTDEGVFWTAPITVQVQNAAPPTPVESWRAIHFSAAQLNDPAQEATVWGPDADADYDGLTTDAEFALGTNPNDPTDGHGGVTHAIVEENGRSVLTMTFQRRNDDPELTVDAQMSDNMASWSSSPSVIQTVSVFDLGNGYEVVTVKDIPPPVPRTSCFGRVLIQRTTP